MTKEVEEYRGNIYKYSCDNPECNETVTSEKVPEDIGWIEIRGFQELRIEFNERSYLLGGLPFPGENRFISGEIIACCPECLDLAIGDFFRKITIEIKRRSE